MTNLLPKKWLLSSGSLSALLILILWMLGIVGGEKTAPGVTPLPAQAAAPQKSAVVERRSVPAEQYWPGSVKAVSETRLAPKINGRIVTVSVHEGDTVKQGDILAKLDAEQSQVVERQAQSLAAAAEAEALRAEADLQRVRQLFRQEAATREAYDHAEAAARKARAGAKAAQFSVRETAIQRNETEIRAPFAGIVSKRLHDPGDVATVGDSILILYAPDRLRLEASVPASCAERAETGDAATVRIDALQAAFNGKIEEIVPAADPATGTVLLKIALPAAQGLQPGLFGWLLQTCGAAHETLLIPAAALRRIGQIEIVTVQQGKTQSTRHVRSGAVHGDRIEILSGLDAGETVVYQ